MIGSMLHNKQWEKSFSHRKSEFNKNVIEPKSMHTQMALILAQLANIFTKLDPLFDYIKIPALQSSINLQNEEGIYQSNREQSKEYNNSGKRVWLEMLKSKLSADYKTDDMICKI